MGGGERAEATVNDIFTKNPNKKNFFGGGEGGGLV